MKMSRLNILALAKPLLALLILLSGQTAMAQSSALAVSQVDPAQARKVAASQPMQATTGVSNEVEAASALAEILNRFAAGEPIDARLVASANAMSAPPADDGNLALVRQDGTNNEAAITQKGRNNDATIVQRGDLNASKIDQTGNNNIAEHVQIGNGLALEVVQNGNATVYITQGPR